MYTLTVFLCFLLVNTFSDTWVNALSIGPDQRELPSRLWRRDDFQSLGTTSTHNRTGISVDSSSSGGHAGATTNQTTDGDLGDDGDEDTSFVAVPLSDSVAFWNGTTPASTESTVTNSSTHRLLLEQEKRTLKFTPGTYITTKGIALGGVTVNASEQRAALEQILTDALAGPPTYSSSIIRADGNNLSLVLNGQVTGSGTNVTWNNVANVARAFLERVTRMNDQVNCTFVGSVLNEQHEELFLVALMHRFRTEEYPSAQDTDGTQASQSPSETCPSGDFSADAGTGRTLQATGHSVANAQVFSIASIGWTLVIKQIHGFIPFDAFRTMLHQAQNQISLAASDPGASSAFYVTSTQANLLAYLFTGQHRFRVPDDHLLQVLNALHVAVRSIARGGRERGAVASDAPIPALVGHVLDAAGQEVFMMVMNADSGPPPPLTAMAAQAIGSAIGSASGVVGGAVTGVLRACDAALGNLPPLPPDWCERLGNCLLRLQVRL
ncbi:MAG: hypothetical protein M1838_003852 [Thelocarpon superellum]|nr:MAG: hypothetical protein M1838_003852 [Thelocarpon superellum]